MKSVFQTVIAKGGYDLTALLSKIDVYHIEGKLTDDERAELYSLARKAPTNQYDCFVEIEKLWEAVRALQKGETSATDEWKEWVQPTGAHDAYQNGAQIVFNGNKYRCVMANCVYSPDVYPAAWELVEE